MFLSVVYVGEWIVKSFIWSKSIGKMEGLFLYFVLGCVNDIRMIEYW